jgi:type VI secretion system protein ImpJ
MTHGLPAIPDRIQWHEGMLLGPQHFQQLQARVDALGAWQQLAAQPLSWGLRHLEIDPGLLAAGRLRIERLEAVMPDGTPVWHDARDALDGALELDLTAHAAALDAGAVLDLHLTLPWSRVMRHPAAPARFRDVNDRPVEDEVSDAEPVDLPRLRPRLGLALGDTPPSLWQSLGLGSLRRDNGLTRLSDDWPALARLEREHPLWRRAWALCSQLRGKAAYLARQEQLPSSRLEDRLAGLEQRARLGALLAALTPLEALLQTRPLHPHTLYLALAAALGPLATLRPGSMPMLPPAYVHEAPRAAFDKLLEALEDLGADVSQEHRLHPFDLRGEVFTLPLRADWLGTRLVIGLRGQAERDLLAWMDGAVIGTTAQWASLRERRVLGAARERLDAAPELGLRGNSGYTLFAVDPKALTEGGGESLLITNASGGQAAQRPHEAVLFVKG